MSSPAIRSATLERIRARLESHFGPAGTAGKWLRTVTRGPLQPSGANRAKANVSDGGQSRAGNDEDAGGSDRLLSVLVHLQIADNWERTKAQDDWSQRAESLIAALEGWRPPSATRPIRYVSDDPCDVIFSSGASEAGWELVFEVAYCADRQQDESAE